MKESSAQFKKELQQQLILFFAVKEATSLANLLVS